MDILTKRPESHLAKFIDLYLEFGIECIVNEGDDGYFIAFSRDDYYDSEQITLSPKFDGYTGFFTRIRFDKEGNFLSQGFWE